MVFNEDVRLLSILFWLGGGLVEFVLVLVFGLGLGLGLGLLEALEVLEVLGLLGGLGLFPALLLLGCIKPPNRLERGPSPGGNCPSDKI